MLKTQENLLKAITGESIARNKYTFYAQKAIKDGYVWIAKVFEETADNERAHAEREYEFMEEKVEMTNTYNLDNLSDTKTNLLHAAEGEKYETKTMYPDFEVIAREEGFTQIADTFKEISEVEEKHEERYLKLADRLENGNLYSTDDDQTEWKCLNCGYVHKGNSAPDKCPVCAKPQGWYMQIGFVR